MLLPSVVGRGQTSSDCVHVALYRAAQQHGCHVGVAHRLAGEAVDLLVDYLADLHDLRGSSPAEQHNALRAWAHQRNVGSVSWALRAAAEHWRAELTLAMFSPAGR